MDTTHEYEDRSGTAGLASVTSLGLNGTPLRVHQGPLPVASPVGLLMRTRDQAATLASVTDEDLIAMLAITARTACRRITPGQLASFSGSVAQAESLPAKPYWNRKAVAHAEVIGILGDVTGDPVLMRLAGLAVGWTYDLAVAAGPGADGIILGSRRRLIGHLRAGEVDAAGQEIESHLRVLAFLGRLSRSGRSKAAPVRLAHAPCSAA